MRSFAVFGRNIVVSPIGKRDDWFGRIQPRCGHHHIHFSDRPSDVLPVAYKAEHTGDAGEGWIVSQHAEKRRVNIQDWGAIGEIVGALAVVASLIYLAVQIRQNTRQISLGLESTKLAAFEQNVESGNRGRELLITNPEITELFLKGLADYHSLRSTEKFRCNMLFRNIFSAIQGGYIRQLTIGGDPEGFKGIGKTLDSLLENPGLHQWLEDVEPDWRPEFGEFVAARIGRNK